MKRIAFIIQEDYMWTFSSWYRTFPVIQKKYDMVGIVLVPKKLGKMRGIEISFWYLRTFGLLNFVLLSLYSIKLSLRRLFSKASNWEALCRLYNIDLFRCSDPNSPEVSSWLESKSIDIAFISIPYILKEDIILKPKFGMINKHASLLPSCKGIFPFFWAVQNNLDLGITLHMVEKEVDNGAYLVQIIYNYNNIKNLSMLRYYIDVFHIFPILVLVALDKAFKSNFIKRNSEIESSYFGLPRKEDYFRFKEGGHSIVRFKDLFYKPSKLIEKSFISKL